MARPQAAAMGAGSSSAGPDRSLILSGPAEDVYCRANNAESRLHMRPGAEEPQEPLQVPGANRPNKAVAHLFQREPDS
jgi:hypothetical protein